MIQLKPCPEIEYMLSQELICSTESVKNFYQWINDCFRVEFGLSNKVAWKEVVLEKSVLSRSFNIQEKTVRTIGVDFPVLLSKGENRPTMMVCAMDPLRHDSKAKQPSNEMGCWVPFSIINNPSKQTKHSEKENLSFFHSLLDTYDLYVTDIFKLFYRTENKTSNTINDFKKLPVHRNILDAEIKIIKPSAILTLGNNARDAICAIMSITKPNWTKEVYKTKSKHGIDLIMVPHISGAANGAKAPILNNPLYKNVVGKNNMKYAQIIIKTLKD